MLKFLLQVFQKGYDVFKALIHFSVEAASKGEFMMKGNHGNRHDIP